jgi:hypothetical protein
VAQVGSCVTVAACLSMNGAWLTALSPLHAIDHGLVKRMYLREHPCDFMGANRSAKVLSQFRIWEHVQCRDRCVRQRIQLPSSAVGYQEDPADEAAPQLTRASERPRNSRRP